ncbi:MAG: ABC transporter ATP-binding protein [Clostridia bacterium]|nr:ABC transporter ATP-binding protein [Clostridia bacterium]
MINLRNITKTYGSGETSFHALNDISLDIEDGQFVCIVGKSGSGKSTLLNITGTLDRATSGTICIDGVEVHNLKGKQLAKFRNEKIGFVFQNFYLEPEYTVYENVEIPLVVAGSYGKGNVEKIARTLALVHLTDKVKNKVKTLSGGEQQRVAIARAIINDPAIILADEPCGNLDAANSENIIDIFKRLHKEGKTVIMVTHDEEDAKAGQRIITLSDGKVANDEKNTISC